jgi:protein TonB
VEIPEEIAEEELSDLGIEGGVDGGVEGGVVGGVLGGVVGGVLGGVVGEVEAPVRAVGEIKPPKLIKEVLPLYPEIARQARVEGVVIVEAITDIYGRVQTVKVLRSIPLLDKAATDAVRQWVYEPMVINGRPRGVIFTVTVRFKLK